MYDFKLSPLWVLVISAGFILMFTSALSDCRNQDAMVMQAQQQAADPIEAEHKRQAAVLAQIETDEAAEPENTETPITYGTAADWGSKLVYAMKSEGLVLAAYCKANKARVNVSKWNSLEANMKKGNTFVIMDWCFRHGGSGKQFEVLDNTGKTLASMSLKPGLEVKSPLFEPDYSFTP